MKILIMAIFALVLANETWASSNCEKSNSKSDIDFLSSNNLESQKTIVATNQFQSLKLISNAPTDERRGCCSHHRGVCGCADGRAVCCDNTISPSCGCD